MSSVKPNPKGSRQHDHVLHGKINDASIYDLEHLFGDRHSAGDGNKITAEWYLVTPHGSATIHNYWAFNEGEWSILSANDRTASLVVAWLREHKVKAYLKPQL